MTLSTSEHAAAVVPFPVTHHRTDAVDGVNIFYRQAGPEDAPVVLVAARISDLLAHVPKFDPVPCRPLPRDRARLSRLRAKRCSRSQHLRLYVRSFRRIGRWPARPAACDAIRDLRHGLWSACRLALGAKTSRTHHRPYRPERQCLRRGSARILGSDQEILGRRQRR